MRSRALALTALVTLPPAACEIWLPLFRLRERGLGGESSPDQPYSSAAARRQAPPPEPRQRTGGQDGGEKQRAGRRFRRACRKRRCRKAEVGAEIGGVDTGPVVAAGGRRQSAADLDLILQVVD